MTIKRCYPVLVGASVVENQLVQSGATSVTVPNGHKYYSKINGTETLGASTGTAIAINDSAEDMVIDLSLMLPSNIADYIYTLETATAGSGIAWLREFGFITDDYKPYNVGTLESVEATAKVVRDVNGENAVTYALGNDKLRGIFKLDSNNNLYADGDRKTADGTITRKYGVVDLGTLTWNYNSTVLKFTSIIEDKAKRYSTDFGSINICCGAPLTAVGSVSSTAVELPDKSIVEMCHSSGVQTICVTDLAYTDAAAFKTAMSGVYLVYELQTSTTETSTPFTSPQFVYPDGTEEFITENGVPVGHESKYQL